MMATYFHGGSEIQAAAAAAGGGGGGDQNLQTLYLMNPNFIAATYSDAQITCTPPNMLFLNPSNAFSQGNLPHAPPSPPPPPPPHQQQFIGIPLSGSHPSEDHGRPSPSSSTSLHRQIPAANLHGLSSVSRVHPNLWSPANNPIRPSHSQPGPIPASGPDMGDPMGFRRGPTAAQGLSLSLSPGMQMQPNQSQVTVTLGGGPSTNGVIPGSKYLKAAQQLLEEVVNVGDNFNGTDFISNDKPGGGNSKNEVGDNRTRDSSGAHKEKAKATTRDQSGVGEGLSHGGDVSVGGESSSTSGGSLKAAELSTAQRQELQMKKAKLLNMLDEVEQRYRQYSTQMQVVVSSFEQAAGSGSAKLYTSLALKTISKQFRCLKDAILCQIKGTSKSLGEEGGNGNNANTGVKLEGQGGAGSRLRFVDHQLRQQRALQQLGMMQHNAWRPQRGLPERAVSVLRAWLFEHFLHPYPKDSDKLVLAKQTGLTRSQVSNWFINARVRLWKPMVEEMYLEEVRTTQEQKSGNNSEDNTTTNTWRANNNNSNSSKNETQLTTKETGGVGQQDHGGMIAQGQQQQQEAGQTTNDMISNWCATSSQGFTLIGASSDMESLMGRSPKKQRSNSDMQNNSPSSILSMDMEMKAVDHHHRQRHSFLMTTTTTTTNNNNGEADAAGVGTGFNPYVVNHDMAGRFNPDQMTYNGNAVSLTLGLPHCDNLSLENAHQNFLPHHQGIPLARRLHIGAPGDPDFCPNNMPQPSHPANAPYDTLDLQNRKRFAAQILHDFVASQ